MRRVLVLSAVRVLGAAPVAQAAKPSVTFKRKTLVRSVTGTRITQLPRGRALQFDVRYVVRNVPARWTHANAQVFVTLTSGANVLKLKTNKAATETGNWRWVVKGAGVRIPESYPAGRYTVTVRVDVRHGGKLVAKAAHNWRATVK
jgi:hypothetical protein